MRSSTLPLFHAEIISHDVFAKTRSLFSEKEKPPSVETKFGFSFLRSGGRYLNKSTRVKTTGTETKVDF